MWYFVVLVVEDVVNPLLQSIQVNGTIPIQGIVMTDFTSTHADHSKRPVVSPTVNWEKELVVFE
jgi:hypothetical protein